MNNLDKILDDHLSQEERDKILEQAINAKFDAALKAEWKKKLAEKYGVSKNTRIISLPNQRRRLLYLGAIAASICLFIIAFKFLAPAPNTPQKLAYAYLEEAEVFHPGALKGVQNNQQNREQAIEAFNTRNYPEAARLFSQLANPTDEDIYYGGLAYLLDKKYRAAITQFEKIANKPSNFLQEVTWYLAIALVLDGKDAQAKALLLKINESDWNHDQAQKLLKLMD